MSDPMYLNLVEILAAVLEVDVEQISLESSKNDFDDWDSLATMEVMSKLEDLYEVRFSAVDIMSVGNVSQILNLLTQETKSK